MKKITEINVENKKILLRCDLNVSIKNGKILSDERIKASLKTIDYLINKNAKVIIMSHLGKIKDEKDKDNNSLFIVYKRLCELLSTKVLFSSATKGRILEEKINSLKPGEVLLMENTRYEDLNEQAESKCNVTLSKYWASLGDIFINDAFGMTHRKHASNYGIAKYLPSAIGFLVEEEINGLDKVIKPKHPFVVVMGGAKVDDKLDLITKILPKCDYLLLGGGIANSFLGTSYNIGKSLTNEEKYSELKKLLHIYKERIILPKDVIVENDNKISTKLITDITDNDVIYDIGKETIKEYKEYIELAKTIFLNGTMGMYESSNYEEGTKKILKSISSQKSYTVIGGGDALTSVEYFKINGFKFISTGGGASLDYLANEKLKCMDK